jgi:hypothetical protein
MASPDIYSFNGQDHEFTVRLYNSAHDIRLSNTAWEDLFLEEDIFDWKIKGSITIKSPQESFERESKEALSVTKTDKEHLVYKFRNDGRDTIFITIKPLLPPNAPNIIGPLTDKMWRLEIEGVIYDVEDLPNENVTEKFKKLYFHEKTYQMMTEKDSDFSTATAGANKNKDNLSQLSNEAKSLTPGNALGELLKSDVDFQKHSKLVDNPEEWDQGSISSKSFYSAPVGAKFIDDMEYFINYTVASEAYNAQPCIFKFERAEKTLTPKQFSLKPIQKYFEKAGSLMPKEYQIEHFFIYEHSMEDQIVLRKAPLNVADLKTEIKSDEQNSIRGYQLVDLSGQDYAQNLANYRVTAFNSTKGQFNEEGIKHTVQAYKDFFNKSIKPFILTQNEEDRLALTPFIKNNLNTKTVYSLRTDENARLANGRNRMLKYYLFSNLAISFSVRGSSHRQTGRFFGLSKQAQNTKEFDNKLEGQYFVTNVIHHFSNSNRNYTNQLIGVKTHTYKEFTKFESDDVMIIK